MKDETGYCYQCGSALEKRLLENRQRESCPACGWIHYRQLKVAAAALIEEQGKLLLLQRAQPPWQGCWNLPAGYVEVDEDPARAAERETQEECGLLVEAIQLLDALFFDDDPRGNGLLLVYRCRARGGKLQSSSEAPQLGFFSTKDLPEPLTGAGHSQVIQNWSQGRYPEAK